MGLLHRGPGARLAKLERVARERPCPGCGRVYSPCGPRTPHDVSRLDASEQEELAVLLRTAFTEPCVRCGRAGLDIYRLADEQKRRLLVLLRVVCASESERP